MPIWHISCSLDVVILQSAVQVARRYCKSNDKFIRSFSEVMGNWCFVDNLSFCNVSCCQDLLLL